MRKEERMDEKKLFREAVQKHKEIKNRLEEYKKHKNDLYSYYPEEIKAVRELRDNASEDIEFLLDILDRILPEEFKKLFLSE